MTGLHFKARLIAIVSASAAMMGCSKPERHGSPAEADDMYMPAARFYLAEAPLQKASVKALDGDPEAADDVFMHYTVARPNDHKVHDFWMRVAAENGNPGYMQLYAMELHELGGETNCRRALFWVRRAIAVVPESATYKRTAESIEHDARCGWTGRKDAL